MAPFQLIFVRNVRQLYTRGAKKDEFAALDRYFRSPNPQALLVFIADFLRIPSDTRRMDMEDKARFDRLNETLGEHCGMVELARVNEEDAMRWIASTAQEAGTRVDPDAARELVDALGADMMCISSELEKLMLYASGTGPHHAGRRGDDGAERQAEIAVRADGRDQFAESCARHRLVAWAAEQLRRR